MIGIASRDSLALDRNTRIFFSVVELATYLEKEELNIQSILDYHGVGISKLTAGEEKALLVSVATGCQIIIRNAHW
jgi:hypothetical protein